MEPFVTKKSAGVVAQLQHMKLEGLCPDAMSIGIVGGVFVIFSQPPLSEYPILETILSLFSEYNTAISKI